jgi:hypothetical protein
MLAMSEEPLDRLLVPMVALAAGSLSIAAVSLTKVEAGSFTGAGLT